MPSARFCFLMWANNIHACYDCNYNRFIVKLHGRDRSYIEGNNAYHNLMNKFFVKGLCSFLFSQAFNQGANHSSKKRTRFQDSRNLTKVSRRFLGFFQICQRFVGFLIGFRDSFRSCICPLLLFAVVLSIFKRSVGPTSLFHQ